MRVTGYSFPLHVHILCIWYATALANTAVLYIHVRIVSLPVCGAPLCYYNTKLHCDDYFSSSSVVSRAFPLLCRYSKFGHHPHPLGYLCAKFCFFCSLYCWDRPWKEKCTQTITQSPSLFDVPGTEACASELHDKMKVVCCLIQYLIQHLLFPLCKWQILFCHFSFETRQILISYSTSYDICLLTTFC